MSEELTRLTAVSKVFFTDEVETHALHSVSLTIARGEYLAIAGPSGCGKSTLLSILGLLDRPTEGEHFFDGVAVSELSVVGRARLRSTQIGFVFQAFNLIPDMTVFENVELPMVYSGVPPAQRRSRVLAVLERLGLESRSRHFPPQLSGGQQQRAAVARAVVTQPAIILADEPTGNLDSTNGAAVLELLGQVHKEGTAICLVSHDTSHMANAGRIVHLIDGCVSGEEVVTGSANNAYHEMLDDRKRLESSGSRDAASTTS